MNSKKKNSALFTAKIISKPLVSFTSEPKPSSWLEASKVSNPLLDTDILVYRSPEKLNWLKIQEKKYGKLGEI
ncbi:hypothetical protein [Lactococcus cremoris]|uniref:hypothetical protein n=1 Tax=Lactococcus lactis subsp. cremoris TaxID=1359 RepID=UPI0007AEADEC|nr:hypothetical protein [Lactococcus cremoris]